MLIFLFGIKIVHLMRLEISFDVFKSEFFSSALVSSSCLAFNKLFLYESAGNGFAGRAGAWLLGRLADRSLLTVSAWLDKGNWLLPLPDT